MCSSDLVVGARVYTIQIGDGDVVDVQDGFDLFGNPRYVQVRFPVNPELLQTMAKTTGGQSYVATDAKALQKSMHDVLDALLKSIIYYLERLRYAVIERLLKLFVYYVSHLIELNKRRIFSFRI